MTPYYADDLVTIYHGDSRKILPHIGPVGLAVTDPPYAFGRSKPEWRVTASIPIILADAAHHVAKGGRQLGGSRPVVRQGDLWTATRRIIGTPGTTWTTPFGWA